MASELPFLETFTDDDSSNVPSSGTASDEWETIPLEIDTALLRDFCHGVVEFPVESLEKSNVSESGKGFVKKLLVADPKSRMSAADALESPWLLGSVSICCNRLVRFVEKEKPGLRSFFPGDLKEVLYPFAKKASKTVETLRGRGCPDEVLRDMPILSLYDIALRVQHLEPGSIVLPVTSEIYFLPCNHGVGLHRFGEGVGRVLKGLDKSQDMKKPLLVLAINSWKEVPEEIDPGHLEGVMINVIENLKGPPARPLECLYP